MSAYTTLVNVDTDTSSKLIQFIGASFKKNDAGTAFTSQCGELIESSNFEALIEKIIEQKEIILTMDDERDAESCYRAIAIMLTTAETEQSIENALKLVIESISLSSDARIKLKLRILISLFNLMRTDLSKFIVLRGIFSFASKTNYVHAVSKFHNRIVPWVQEWNLTVEQRRELFKLTSDVLQKDGQESSALHFLVKYLTTFEEYPSDVLASVTNAVINAIKSPIASFTDRIALYEILSKNELKNDDLSNLVELLRILCSDTLGTYVSYSSKNSDLLSKYGISATDTLRVMRLLSLCSLCSTEPQISYDSIAKELDVSVDDVELWVVEGISQGLLEASMDQFNASVTISRCSHRSFGLSQWTSVQERLREWKKSVTHVLDTMKRHGGSV